MDKMEEAAEKIRSIKEEFRALGLDLNEVKHLAFTPIVPLEIKEDWRPPGGYQSRVAAREPLLTNTAVMIDGPLVEAVNAPEDHTGELPMARIRMPKKRLSPRVRCFFHLMRNIFNNRHAAHITHDLTPGKEHSVYRCACGKYF